MTSRQERTPKAKPSRPDTQNFVLSGRLKAVREAMKLSQTEIARDVGVAMRTWQDYEAAKTSPGAAALAGLYQLNVDLGWLLTGQGDMFRPTDPPTLEGMVAIPRHEIRPSAGGGAYVDTEEPAGFLALNSEWIRSVLVRKPEHLVLFEAGGDSMYPTIADRDPLIIDQSDRELRQDAIYVFRIDDTVQVKRIQRQTSGSVKLISDNERYAPEVLSRADAERLHVIGRVVWHGHKL